MKITFLGTSSGVPTNDRNVTSVVVQLGKRYCLFDCGESTQNQLRLAGVSPQKIDTICISHLHGDHIYGLPGLLGSMSMMGRRRQLQVIGAKGIRDYIEQVLALSFTHLSYDIVYRELENLNDVTSVGSSGPYEIFAIGLVHRVPSFGFKVSAPDSTGEFDNALADQLGVPRDKSRAMLCQGKSITLDNGKVVTSAEVIGEPRKGKSFAICTDTSYSDNAIALSANVDVLVHECTYAESERDLAIRGVHSTSHDAAQVAKKANVGHLVLTHFSPRYGHDEPILVGTEPIFTNITMAVDFLSIEV